MNKLMEKKPVLHAILWIIIYIVLVNIGDALSEQFNADHHMATGVLVLVLSAVLVLYLKKSNRLEAQGFRRMTKTNVRNALFYCPLILLAVIQLSAGIDRTISLSQFGIICLLMVGTGFVEELIFRGLLFQGIKEKSGVNKAVIISGVTFGMGHIVNLLRGYGYAESVGQIIVAIAVGIVLALLVGVTKNIVPGILFHIIFNISGAVSNLGTGLQTILLIVILVISVLYAIYLFKVMQRQEKSEKPPVNTETIKSY